MNHTTVQRGVLVLALAVLGTAALAGCGPDAGGPKAPPRAAVAAAAAPPTEPAAQESLRAFYQQKLSWTPCGDQQCATLTVPMHYAQPANGRTFTLPVIRTVGTDPVKRLGSLVLDPGGPGQSGVRDMKSGGMAAFGPRMRASFDVVEFDPRGVAGSKPALDCGSPDDAANQGGPDDVPRPLYPRTDAERRAALADAEATAAGCKAHSGDILSRVGTLDVARDMDVLRAALGDEKLNYLGWSYGTYLGATYAELFPQRVRAMVLDGADDPAKNWSERTIMEGKAFKRAVDGYADQCVTVVGDACPAATPEAIRQLITDLYTKVAHRSLKIQGTSDRLDVHMLNTAVTMSMYTPEAQWQPLSEALSAARRGDGTKLAALAAPHPADQADGSGASAPTASRPAARDRRSDGSSSSDGQAPDNSEAALLAVNCLDVPHPKDPQAYWDALAPADRAAGPFGTAGVLADLSCKDLPTGPRQPHRVDAPGLPPVLVVGTTGDPVTAYENAQSLASQLPGGMLLTFQGQGHTAYGRSNACVTDAVDAYLVDLKPVKTGATC
ncbi:alpha/beta hydrolase [Kitasatospora sp. McL0602]|uniref:alpha/beta hydrolase n=1 Tax=Kitasatospora sp. McL0602 TaxID=3439530 RepID=UPI003F8BA923